jgi:hypothetical protein
VVARRGAGGEGECESRVIRKKRLSIEALGRLRQGINCERFVPTTFLVALSTKGGRQFELTFINVN